MSLKLLRGIIVLGLIGGMMLGPPPSFSLADKPPKGTLAIQEILVSPQEVVPGETVGVTIKCSYSAPRGIKFGQWICLVGVLVYDSDGILIAGDEGEYRRWEEYKRGVTAYECGEDGESGVFSYSFTLATQDFSPGVYTYRFKIYGSQRTTGLGQPYWVIYHFTDEGTFSFQVKEPATPPEQKKTLTETEEEEPPEVEPPPPQEFSDNLVITDSSFPYEGSRVRLKSGKSFMAVINFNLYSVKIATIKAEVIAVLEEGGEQRVCERSILVNKGYNKTLEVELPSNLPPTTQKIIISAKLISSESGQVIAADKITASRWVPTEVEIIPPEEPIIANGRGIYIFKVKLTQKGKPVENARVEIWPKAAPQPFFTEALINQAEEIVHLTTNAAGEVAFKFTPPRLIKIKSLRRVRQEELWYPIFVRTPGLAKDRIFRAKLIPPHPRIKSVRISELSSGDWQKIASVIEVDDPDSDFFTYTIYFNGNIGWKGGHLNFKKLVAQGEKIFYFRLKPKKFGLDLQNLPDLRKNLLEANKKFFLDFLKQYLYEKSPFYYEEIKLVYDFKKLGKDVGKSASKLGEKVEAIQDGWDVYNFTLEGYNTTVGVVDYTLSVLDYIKRKTPSFSLVDFSLRLAYENAKAFYKVYDAHRRVADAVEDVILFPIIIQVEDEDGYWDRQLRQVPVRFWKK